MLTLSHLRSDVRDSFPTSYSARNEAIRFADLRRSMRLRRERRAFVLHFAARCALALIVGFAAIATSIASGPDPRGYRAALLRGDIYCAAFGKASPNFVAGRCRTAYDAASRQPGVDVCPFALSGADPSLSYQPGHPFLCRNGVTVLPDPS